MHEEVSWRVVGAHHFSKTIKTVTVGYYRRFHLDEQWRVYKMLNGTMIKTGTFRTEQEARHDAEKLAEEMGKLYNGQP